MHKHNRNFLIILLHYIRSSSTQFVEFYRTMMNNEFMKIKNLKLILLFIVFLMILTGIRLLWTSLHPPTNKFTAKKGNIQLTSEELKSHGLIHLNGEWEFYPNQLLTPENFSDNIFTEEKKYLSVPAKWDFDRKENYHYGTYRLHIAMDEEFEELTGIRLSGIYSAFQLFINGEAVGGIGKVADSKANYAMDLMPFYTTFKTNKKDFEIVLQVANDSNYRKQGGITNTITFGSATSIEYQKWFSIIVQSIVAAIFLLHFLYVCLLYLIGIRQKILITFSLTVLFTALAILLDNERILLTIFPLSTDWSFRVIHFAYIGATLSLIQFIQDLFPNDIQSRILMFFKSVSVIYLLSLLIFPVEWIGSTRFLFNLLLVISPTISFFLIVKITLQKKSGATFLLFAATAVASSILWEFSGAMNDSFNGYYPFDMLAAIIALSAYWFQRYFQSTLLTETLSKKLQKENDRKEDFLANTSHELRNPLHGMMNIAQIVLESQHNIMNSQQQKNLQLLISIGEYMSLMLNDLLDLSKLKDNQIQLQLRTISIEPVVHGVVDMLRYMIQNKPVQLSIKIDDDFPKVLADENRLMQILFNLIHNAMKYTDEGTIQIQASFQNDEATIQIIDSGIGIEPAFIERIFERYEQKDASMTAIGGGLGLGLTICYELVQLHGGNLTVDSMLEQGSTFTFTLPISYEQLNIVDMQTSDSLTNQTTFMTQLHTLETYRRNEIKTTNTPTSIQSYMPRILIVDDDAVNLKILTQLLEANQYEIKTASTGNEALDLLNNEKFDLLITDLMMPKMSGYELVRIVRANWSIMDLPIVVLTARSQREDMLSAFHLGANDYVTKPVDAVELRARVQALISLRQAVDERSRLEAAWLQAQINPHFFFNILNSIYILSDINPKKMQELIEAISEYLQMSFDFDNTEPVVPIDYELNLVRSYLAIEKIRFEERIQIIWDIEDDLHFSIPPLSIQTLVENAITHGLLPKIEGGILTIKIREELDYYLISISDDGVGFPIEEQNALYREGGIGIPNTNLRLKQLFGTGLKTTSIVGEGTTVSFQIPKER